MKCYCIHGWEKTLYSVESIEMNLTYKTKLNSNLLLIIIWSFKMTEEIEAHVLKKYEILQKLGK